MNGNTERAQRALSQVCIPQEMGKAVKIKKFIKYLKSIIKKIMPSAWLKNKGMYSKNRIMGLETFSFTAQDTGFLFLAIINCVGLG